MVHVLNRYLPPSSPAVDPPFSTYRRSSATLPLQDDGFRPCPRLPATPLVHPATVGRVLLCPMVGTLKKEIVQYPSFMGPPRWEECIAGRIHRARVVHGSSGRRCADGSCHIQLLTAEGAPGPPCSTLDGGGHGERMASGALKSGRIAMLLRKQVVGADMWPDTTRQYRPSGPCVGTRRTSVAIAKSAFTGKMMMLAWPECAEYPRCCA